MKRLSLHLAFLFLLLTSLASATLATDIVISASTQPNLRPTGLPAIRTGTASVSNGSASVTLSTAVPASHVGIGGYIIELAGTNYYVANTTTTTQITLTSNFVGSSGTTTYRIFPFVLLRIYALGTFQPSGANYVVQQGAPGSGSWYKQVGVSVISDGSGSVGYIPQLILDATTNAVNPSTQNTRYFAGFYRIEGGLIAPFLCFEQFRLPSTTTPTTWADICTFNQTTTQPNDPTTYYTARQLDDRWRACSAGQSYYFSAAGNRVSCLNYGTGLSLDTATGTLTATAASPLLGAREAVNFKRDCGGVGDGSTNNATAFENCIADMSDGDTLYLPYGNYKTNSQVLVNKRINLIGDGIGSAITCNTTISVDCVVFDRGGSTLIETARIENLAIVGGANSTRNGLVLVNFVRGDVRNVFIGTGTPSGGYGFVCEGCLINTFEQVVVSNSTPFPYTYGTPDGGMLFKGSSTYPSNANLIKNCIIEPGAGKGIFIDGATGTTGTTNNWIVGGTIEGATMTYGIHIKGANYFSVSNVHVEDLSSTFTKANIKIENSTSGFIGAGSFGNNLEFVNADDITVENLAINNLSVDSASQRNRFGNLTWNLSGTGTFADTGTESTYTGQLRNAGSANASPTGPASAAPSHNLLRNGGAEVWAGSNPTEWGVSSGTLTQTGTGLGDTRKLYGDYAVKVSGGTATTLVNLPAEELPRVLGQSITITGWVYVASGQATQPVVALQVWYNGGTSAYGIAAITATDQWVPVRLTSPVPSNATQVQAAFVNSASAAAGIYYIDGVSITFGRAGVFTEAARLPSGLNLALYNNGGYKTTLKPSNSASANLTFTLPAATAEASPTNADVMVADGGTLSFDKRAKFESGPNLDYFPSWSNTNGTLSASGPLYKFGSDIVTTGHILYGTTNTKDLGATGNRPRNIYVGTSIIFPDGTTQTTAGGGGGGGITAISGTSGGSQTGPSIALAVGTSGTDITFPGSGNTLTLNVPDASASARGVIKSSGSQTLAPNFTLTGTLAVQATTTARQINPETDNTYSLGTSALRWAEMHVAGSSLVVHGDNTNTKRVTYGYSGSTGTITADASSSIQVTTGANSGLTINTSGDATFGGGVTATTLSGNCASCTNISASNIGSGTLAIGRGGTGITTTPSNGQVMIGNGSGYTAATLTATANQTKITNGSGSITLGLADAFDISGVTSTAPVKAGLASATPSTCTANKELYIKTDATAGQQLFLCNSTGNGFNLVGDGGGGGGGVAWSALTDPTGSLSLAMTTYTTTLMAGDATSTNNVFTVKDTSSNSGTGYMVSAETAASSAAKPFRATAGGTSNGIEVNTSGILAALGTGGVSAAALVSGTVPLARLSGITTTQLSASAAVANSQLANSSITINGTSNQITVSSSPVSLGGSTTLSLPQNIHTAATPQFAAGGFGVAAGSVGIKIEATSGTPLDITNSGASKFSVATTGSVTLAGQITGSASVVGPYGATYTNTSTDSSATAETNWLNSAGNYLRAGIRSTGASPASESFLESNGSTNGIYINANDSGSRIRFGINNSEQGRWTATGLCVGCTSASVKLHVNSGSAGVSGIRTTQMTSTTAATAGAVPVGIDSSGNLVIAGSALIRTASKTAHGFTLGMPIYNDASGIWQKALATGASTLPTAIVTRVIDTDNFEYGAGEGEFTLTAHGLSTGSVYYLQDAGGLGTSAGTISYTVGAPTGTNTFQYYGVRATNVPDGDKGDISVSAGTWSIDNGVIGVAKLSATGTPSSTTCLKGDDTWGACGGFNSTSGTLPYYNGTTFADSPVVRSSSTAITVGGSLLGLSGAGSGAAVVTMNGNALIRPADSLYRSLFLTQSGNASVSGNGNFCFGLGACTSITSGANHIGLGAGSLAAATTAGDLVAIGRSAGDVATGDNNTFVGALAGFSNVTSGTRNTLIGQFTRVPTATANGQISINNFIVATGATDTGNSYGTGQLGIGNSAPGAKLHVTGTATGTDVLTVQGASGQTAPLQKWTDTSSNVMLSVNKDGLLLQSGTPQTLTGAGAVNLTTYSTLVVTTGADALTLAAGTEGQTKFVRMKTDGGDGTLTVTNGQGFTTITFNDAGDFVLLFYLDSKWHILTNSGCTVA